MSDIDYLLDEAIRWERKAAEAKRRGDYRAWQQFHYIAAGHLWHATDIEAQALVPQD